MFYLLIIIKADWRRVRTKKKNFKRAFTTQEKKIFEIIARIIRFCKSFLKIKQQQKKMFQRKPYNIEKLK
jgi:hypothetical protein